jgi:DNA recombination protein RmuC
LCVFVKANILAVSALSVCVIIALLFIVLLMSVTCIRKTDTILTFLLEDKKTLQSLEGFFDKQIKFLYDCISQQIVANNGSFQKQLESIHKQLLQTTHLNESKIEGMRTTLEEKINQMLRSNHDQLENIRETVQEKLQSTLERRLGESFNIVSNQLEMVYKGIGEMKNLATDVGDLKKVLSNVKTRGVWGEVQLENILKQILSEEQYLKNAQTNELSRQRVEFAIKMPVKSENNNVVLMPIDAKFPLTEYHKLIDLYESSDRDSIAKQLKVLVASLKKEAKNINQKYINPPVTTDFAIMFLPIEGLYAELVRVPELLDTMQREYKVIVASPVTLTALLNTIQMGFKTFCIEKRSNEVWQLLNTIRFEFNNFIGLLNKTKIKLDQASKAIGDAEYKGNIINNKLQNVNTTSLPK